MLRRNVWLALALGIEIRKILPERFIFLHDYAFIPRRRYTEESPHPKLSEYLSTFRSNYEQYLVRAMSYEQEFTRLPTHLDAKRPQLPNWVQIWFSGLDAIMLYTMIVNHRPRRFVEIGSGASTKFARWAIDANGLDTFITSIDPEPRDQVDQLIDRVIRDRLEDTALAIFDELAEGDILFVDSSHRCFSNSDVTSIFLDVLPRLRKGVLVHFHDVFLPFDYPEEFQDKYYSEQYLLATSLLQSTGSIEVLMASNYVLRDAFLGNIGILGSDLLKSIDRTFGGTSLWFKYR
jgi:hypothetical protein